MLPFEHNFEHNFERDSTYEVSIQKGILIEMISRESVIAKTWTITISYVMGLVELLLSY